MTEPDLPDLIERAAARTPVGPPPLEAMLDRDRQRRRRHAALWTTGGSALAVATLALVALLAAPDGTTEGRSGPPLAPDASSQTGAPSKDPRLSFVDHSLEGSWRVRSLLDDQGKSLLPRSRDRLRLTFNNGELGGTTGCNDIFGRYTQSGEGGRDLRIPPAHLGSTLVGCRDEPPLVKRLLQVRHVAGSGDVRWLQDDRYQPVVELRRQ